MKKASDEPETNETGAAYSNYSDMYAIGMYKIRWWKEESNKPYKLYAWVAEGSLRSRQPRINLRASERACCSLQLSGNAS